ncbi:hypothetical protein CFB81_32355 [Burkholderia sp. AU28863]|nr:hypothetical protein CFB81_32355 [Burkholderia sp. AU28863]
MNQGKKSFAHHSAPLKTQNRRVLPATCSTICGAIGRGAAGPADARHVTAAGSPAGAALRQAAVPPCIDRSGIPQHAWPD